MPGNRSKPIAIDICTGQAWAPSSWVPVGCWAVGDPSPSLEGPALGVAGIRKVFLEKRGEAVGCTQLIEAGCFKFHRAIVYLLLSRCQSLFTAECLLIRPWLVTGSL